MVRDIMVGEGVRVVWLGQGGLGFENVMRDGGLCGASEVHRRRP